MPVEIEELVVRVVVAPSGGGQPASRTDSDARRDELVAEVVEQVLAILRQKEER
ncbi:MAG: hypothetical protein H7A45_20295 [Verrucomicrobiales bacterium]|nr:hypothetical protein [Verrucomicrobiales bacterium]MCP5527848.1 hypothetical protein [Verrucomicrobiales bacterium]